MHAKPRLTAALAAGVAGLLAASASADVIVTGDTFRLHNHPDGSAANPLYGLRLDELYNATSSHDIFTFDFDHASSNMTLTYTGSTIRIQGVTFGGRDIGSSYANDVYRGVYIVDFLYSVGVGLAPGDDDIRSTAATGVSSGSIITPLGHIIPLRNNNMGGYTFRFGDTDNDAGHRGFDGLSGWGWLDHGTSGKHVEYSDWLFTGDKIIPAPGAAAALGLGGLTLARRKRR